MRGEFNVQYDLNRLFLDVDQDFHDLTTGQGAMIRASDYDDQKITVRPAADPNIVSDTERQDQAKLLVARAQSTPGYNRYQTELRFLKSMSIPEIDQILPPPMTQGPDGKPAPAQDYPPPPNPKMMEIQIKQQAQQLEQQQFMSEQMQSKIELQMEVQETMAKIQNLQAQAAEHLANAENARTDPAIKLLYAQIEAEGMHKDRLVKIVDVISNLIQKGMAKNGSNAGAGLAAMEAPIANAGVRPALAGNGAIQPGPMAQPGF
jgi:hypothetical protein